MNFKVVNKLILTEGIKRLDIHAPTIARKIGPGQFVSVCPEEGYERVPLTVVECDASKGVISLIFHEAGATTRKLGAMSIGEPVFSIWGPLGRPASIEKKGEVICIATGIGTAQILPVVRALGQAGNKIIGIIGARTKRKLMLEAQARIACDKIYIATEDGSYEKKALATDILKDLLRQRDIAMVYAIGSPEMMRSVCEITRETKTRTLVQLNPVMVDCMGMCGSCRVRVGHKVFLACIDGPEFDGHKVDFDDYMVRINASKEPEQWRSQQLPPSPPRNEDGIFKRFLSGILNK